MAYAPIKLDGKELASQIEKELATRVETIKTKNGVAPCLATVLVGNDPSSEVYVNMKRKACKRIGMESELVHLPETTSTNELIEVIRD
ncbi:hypothetical protein HYT51_03075 [Candidatus Woesearchaeota archaeon]|nr:hypothetical protein [Candidatus Woesearchaeota archaeon]